MSADPTIAPQSRDSHGDNPRRPTNRQWWRIAQEALKLLEVDAPQDRRSASALIDRLAATASPAPDSVPF